MHRQAQKRRSWKIDICNDVEELSVSSYFPYSLTKAIFRWDTITDTKVCYYKLIPSFLHHALPQFWALWANHVYWSAVNTKQRLGAKTRGLFVCEEIQMASVCVFLHKQAAPSCLEDEATVCRSPTSVSHSPTHYIFSIQTYALY